VAEVLVACALSVLGTFLHSILLCMHVFLAAAGLTTWEFVSFHRIPYLAESVDHARHPFDRGVLLNMLDFFFPVRPSTATYK
jgi:palmitoyltransferase